MRRNDSSHPRGGEGMRTDEFGEALRAIARFCEQAADGDLEVRLPRLPGEDHLADVAAARQGLNRLMDLVDAFVRESTGSLAAASAGNYHRRFLHRGMRGAFRRGAEVIDDARRAIRRGARTLEEANQRRLGLADEFETAVMSTSEHVAAASTELSASAASLAESTRATVVAADRSAGAIRSLSESSVQIDAVVQLINSVAAQTRLLALNATIEAARAGEAGRGFAIVANEVKQLADATARATAQISEQVAGIRDQTSEVVTAIETVTASMRDVESMVAGIRVAAEGRPEAGGADQGLSQMAESLQARAGQFLTELRR
ncbi:methyl-accepting chemotaxis protein [Planosporangium thailandense]|nr:methyl-accepting chemotaxis protein [Planosporangium thailandense]